MSKGLSAPIGSMLVGKKEFIQEAVRVRKMMGGGMRQVGVLAAAALIALEKMPCRLYEDHENAKRLARGLAGISGFEVDLATVETNILIADLNGWTSAQLLQKLKERGVLAGSTGPNQVRFVTHKDVSTGDIDKAVEIIAAACG